VLFRSQALRQIQEGTVSLAFRRWHQARVREGSRLRTAIGVIEITAVTAIRDAEVTDADAKRAGYASADDVRAEFPPGDGRILFKIEIRYTGPDPRVSLRERPVTPDEVEAILGRLDRWDRSAPRGPWTRLALRLIAEHPGRRAAELAPLAGYETMLAFKRDVRKLKELGLTESLEVGYRLSPRGRTVLDRLGEAG
jgi:integrase